LDGVEIVIAGVDLHLRIGSQLANDKIEDARATVEKNTLTDNATKKKELADSAITDQTALALQHPLQRIALHPTNKIITILHAHPLATVLEHDQLLALLLHGHDGRLGARLRAQADVQRHDRQRLDLGGRRSAAPSAVDDDQRQQ